MGAYMSTAKVLNLQHMLGFTKTGGKHRLIYFTAVTIGKN